MKIPLLYIKEESFIISKNVQDFASAVDKAFPLGILYISSSLKKAGYETEILYYNKSIKIKEIIEKIQKTDKMFAISIVSEGDYEEGKKIILKIKEKNPRIKIIVGGPYPTLVPEDMISNKDIDAVCIGEGEIAVLEYAKQVEKGEYRKTDNLWIKENNGNILKCDRSVLIEDIDSVPYPDREGWIKLFKDTKGISHQVLLERGCKYKCIYCSHHALSKKQEGTYLRYRKVEKVIEEIEYVCSKYPETLDIKFNVDNALSNTEYFIKLCEELIIFNKKRKDKISFAITCNVTPNLLKEDKYVINLMKEANIKMISVALDSGSLDVRKQLNRPYYENEQFINFCIALRQQQISFGVNLMYSPIFSTKEIYQETIDCLIKCRPDILQISWLLPLKGTQLYEKMELAKYKNAKISDKWLFRTLKYRVFYGIYGIKMFNYMYPFNKIRIYLDKKYLLYKEKRQQRKGLNIIKAKEAFNKENYKGAIKYFNKVKISKDNYWIFGDRAIAKMNIGDYKGAIKDFDKVLKLEPKEIYKQKRQEILNLRDK